MLFNDADSFNKKLKCWSKNARSGRASSSIDSSNKFSFQLFTW